MIAAIDDAGNSRGAHARLAGNLTESWMGMTFCHWVAAQAQLHAVGQVYAAEKEKLSLYGTNPGWSE
jgi:hypothetical protein